uniref:Wsv423-like protein n=1 Tax=Sesarmops intermedium nimavirus TaxID=2133796 RepID=A0A401IPQ1_9VIRU|nr:MAG: wsv423-like protein [Sesarmops intermedium nimavirus]GBG35593.1 wsv423-like protein [Sesarmops intermedium nimavirus]
MSPHTQHNQKVERKQQRDKENGSSQHQFSYRHCPSSQYLHQPSATSRSTPHFYRQQLSPSNLDRVQQQQPKKPIPVSSVGRNMIVQKEENGRLKTISSQEHHHYKKMGHLFSSTTPTTPSTGGKKMKTKRSASNSDLDQFLPRIKRVKTSSPRPVIAAAVTARPPLESQRITRSSKPTRKKKTTPFVISDHQAAAIEDDDEVEKYSEDSDEEETEKYFEDDAEDSNKEKVENSQRTTNKSYRAKPTVDPHKRKTEKYFEGDAAEKYSEDSNKEKVEKQPPLDSQRTPHKRKTSIVISDLAAAVTVRPPLKSQRTTDPRKKKTAPVGISDHQQSTRVIAVTVRPPLDSQRTTRSSINKSYRVKPTVDLRKKKRTPIVILDHQQSTKRSDYIDELLPPPPSITTTSCTQSSAPQQQRKNNQVNYFKINLTTRVYDSLSIFRSHIGGGKHLGSSCNPVTETILLKRNCDRVEKWEKLTEPPVYFERVEADANICGGAYSSSSFRRQAAQLGLFESIQNVILHFDTLKRQCNNCIKDTDKTVKVPNHWWPVGIEGSVHQRRTCIDPQLLRTNSDKRKIKDIEYMAREVFKLSDSAIANVLNKTSSLLYEVSAVCNQWHKKRNLLSMPGHVPAKYASTTILIGPNERFLEMRDGVYYMLERGTVIKFMIHPTRFTDFVLETAIGYSIHNNIKGAVGVIGTCPEAFCIEMDFAGVTLQDVINGDLNCVLNHPRAPPGAPPTKTVCQQELIQHHMAPTNITKMRGVLYGVRMLQVTGRLPEPLQEICKIPISDSYTAVGVTHLMREKLLGELPFVAAEIVNVVTRLSQQGLVNPDIKSDNVVIDGVTGQPKMIDFGLVIPVGKRDTAREVISSSSASVYSDYPQTAPEYLMGEKCQEAAMTYGLSYMINDMLNTLVRRTGDMGAVSMSVNIPLRAFMVKAYAQDFRERPRAYLMAPLIGACFPFRHSIAKLFNEPKHTLV